MSFVELLLGWGIVALLAIGSIVAADPFWAAAARTTRSATGPRRAEPIAATRSSNRTSSG